MAYKDIWVTSVNVCADIFVLLLDSMLALMKKKKM